MATRTPNSMVSKARAAGLNKRADRRAGEVIIGTLLLLCALISVVTTAAVVFSIAEETVQFFREVSVIEFFTSRVWTPLFANKSFGIAPLVIGTLMVTLIACVIGLPMGLGAAIYLAEFAGDKTRRTITPILEVLAGIPTVALGYFALLFLTPVIRDIIPGVSFFNPISAGIVMGFMIMPTVTSISVDSLRAVPRSLREAGYGLGASKYELITKVIVPAALSGIVASFILAISRAIGETMIVTLAAGQKPTFTFDPRETIATMTSFIVQAGTGDQPAGSIGARSLYAVAAVLFTLTLLLNIVSQQVVQRFSERYE